MFANLLQEVGIEILVVLKISYITRYTNNNKICQLLLLPEMFPKTPFTFLLDK
jgi:hypothetical protein